MKKLSAHQRRARDFLQREDWDKALSELQNVLASDANNPTVHNQMGDVCLRKNDVELACEHFENSIELYAQLGLHNNAVALCRKVIRLCPERIEVRYRLACLRLEQGLRAEATASLEDYFEQLNPDNVDAPRDLEERGREIIEKYPDMAPVGKILEKLEGARSFVAAFRIVQRLAQRAADAGDDAAARRYTEKMRSLRVLVEGNGGGDLLAAEDSDVHESPTGQPEGASHTPEAASGPRGSSSSDQNSTPEGTFSLPEAHEVATASTANVEGLLEGAEESFEFDLPPSASAAVDDEAQEEAADLSLQATWQPSANARTTHDEAPLDRPVTVPPLSIAETSSMAVADRDSVVDPPNRAGPAPGSGAESSAEREYEIPETSLEEVAGMLQDEESASDMQGKTPREAALTLPESAEAERAWAESDLSWKGHDHFTAQTGTQVQPASAPDEQGEREGSANLFTSPRAQGLAPSHARASKAPRDPVWIPDPSIKKPDPDPNDQGEVHELNVVIDTFREQMASALGDDGDARYDLGVAYYEMGLYNEALAEFEVAARCGSFQDRSLEMMAACLMQQDRQAEVIELLQSVLTADGPNARHRLGLRYSMGLAFEALGHREEARRHFEEVALVDIGFKDVQARLQRL